MKASPLDEDFKTGLVAQAKFLRGFAYYHLLTTFGGVPLRNTIPSLETLSIPRASEEEIVAQIEEDWKAAISGLPETSDAGKLLVWQHVLIWLNYTGIWAVRGKSLLLIRHIGI